MSLPLSAFWPANQGRRDREAGATSSQGTKPVECVLAGRRCFPSISAKKLRLAEALQALGANLTYGVSQATMQATISRLQPTPFADARVGAG
jgi:hypothetical protein